MNFNVQVEDGVGGFLMFVIAAHKALRIQDDREGIC
jgi:hypothetical protein